jgi:hypothetical protein
LCEAILLKLVYQRLWFFGYIAIICHDTGGVNYKLMEMRNG